MIKMSQMSGELQFGWMKMLIDPERLAEVGDDHERRDRDAGRGRQHAESGQAASAP